MTIAPNVERIIPVSRDDNGKVETYAKELYFNAHPYSLMIRYFSKDRESFSNDNHYVVIENLKQDAAVQLDAINRFEIDANGYEVNVTMWSSLVETAEELREVAKLLEDTADAKELFQNVLDERFGN